LRQTNDLFSSTNGNEPGMSLRETPVSGQFPVRSCSLLFVYANPLFVWGGRDVLPKQNILVADRQPVQPSCTGDPSQQKKRS
jgi:hypothetical protein